MTSTTPILQLHNVSKQFGRVQAVNDLSFVAEKGQIIALLGPSGCGKTTTLRMIAGFVEPDQGEIRIAGRDMKGIKPYERNVGLVFQDYALFPHLTVAQNIAYGLIQRGFNREQIARKVAEMLEMMRLGGYENRSTCESQRRTAAARGARQILGDRARIDATR